MWFKDCLGTAFFVLCVLELVGHVSATEDKPTWPCKVIKKDLQYDLSDLASKDYWHVVETLHTRHTKEFYLSICHPLQNVPSSCPQENSGICSVTIADDDNTTRHYQNMGQVPTEIKVPDVGRIEYFYNTGEKCSKGKPGSTYKTELHMLCGEDMTGPVLMSSPGCILFFAWNTKAACPKKAEVLNNITCTAKFSNSDHLINLHTLHSSSYYNFTSANGSYEMNFCGPVTNGHCGKDNATICKFDGNGSAPVVLGTTENMELAWHDDHLDLLYKYENKTTEIKLYCDRTATSPQIYFYDKNDTTEVLTVKTAVVCTPEAPQCVFSDKNGNVYDLRPLHRATGNWKVIDSRDGQKTLYHINMCGEVNDEHFYHCPPGPIGACQTSVGADSAYNLGFMTSHPVVNVDGSITVLYSGGDVCLEGHHARSTRINLICDSMEYEPVLLEITKTCEYIFYWRTPAACPRHVSTGGNCQVADPLYGNLYNLSSLRKNNKDYNVSDGIHSYLVNVCGPLVSKCNGEETSTSGLCQIKGSEQFSGGLASSNLTFRDGTLVMKFAGGSGGGCDGNQTRSSQIIFMCDHEESGFDGPVFLQENECAYYFIWRTKEACPPFNVVDCTYVTDNGTVYDLIELSSPVMNEEYFSPDHSKKYVLNVCRSIVHSKDSRCPYKAAACIIDINNENDSISIGEVVNGPVFEDGILKIKYPRGEVCKTNESVQTETIIKFNCDTQRLYPYPQLVAVENCKYIFEWSTPIACPVNNPSTTTTGIKIGGNCQVTNPTTRYHFDLSSLKRDSGYDVHGESELHLILNVCNNVKPDRCPGGKMGACSYTHNNKSITSAGEANAELHFLPGFLFLHYGGGSECQNGLERSTWINFICGAEGTPEGPVLVHDDLDNCTYHINWYTELVCERRIDCFVDTWERRIDLSRLILTSGNYQTSNPSNPKQKFYLNVCRPLNHITGLLCHPGSSACLADSSSPSTPLNLGHPTVTPVNTYDSGVQLMYSAGSVCPTNSGLPVTSKISFICDENAGRGNPVFKEVTHDCQYIFEWKTSLVCEETKESPSGPVCQIMFEAAKANVDLKPLQKPSGYEVKYSNKTFKVNVCGPACNDSGVCTSSGESYGLSSKSELIWDYDKLKLTYYGGDTCIGSISGQKTTAIYFQCDMSAGFGEPVADDVMEDLQCVAVFTWKTNVTCMEGIYSSDDAASKVPSTPAPSSSGNSTADPISDKHKSETSPSSPHSTATAVVATLLVISGIIFVIVLVLLKSHSGQRAMASARRLFGFTGYTDLTQRQAAESSTLLGSTSRVFRVDDSDDDLLRV